MANPTFAAAPEAGSDAALIAERGGMFWPPVGGPGAPGLPVDLSLPRAESAPIEVGDASGSWTQVAGADYQAQPVDERNDPHILRRMLDILAAECVRRRVELGDANCEASEVLMEAFEAARLEEREGRRVARIVAAVDPDRAEQDEEPSAAPGGGTIGR